jgi:hypothetical protein
MTPGRRGTAGSSPTCSDGLAKKIKFKPVKKDSLNTKQVRFT